MIRCIFKSIGKYLTPLFIYSSPLLQNFIPKKILESTDISALTPVRGKLSLIPENLARKFEVVAFDGDGTQVALITTNTFSEELKKIYA